MSSGCIPEGANFHAAASLQANADRKRGVPVHFIRRNDVSGEYIASADRREGAEDIGSLNAARPRTRALKGWPGGLRLAHRQGARILAALAQVVGISVCGHECLLLVVGVQRRKEAPVSSPRVRDRAAWGLR
ncbi:MAG: hypothetical protein B7X99_08405 [Rhizobiales bacterium 17-65-6]|nr:MAG: hypothetical protein B7X99_08405 [Rhizobiales bacterium 17-65-6]